MALKSYVITAPCQAPIVRITGIPSRPQEIKVRKFTKGEIINGEMKHYNNKPHFVLVEGALVVPAHCVKELVTKDINSALTGDNTVLPKAMAPSKNPKVMFVDALVIGGVLGALAAYLAEKKSWIPNTDKMNKVYGAIIGAAIGSYLVYRIRNSKSKPKE